MWRNPRLLPRLKNAHVLTRASLCFSLLFVLIALLRAALCVTGLCHLPCCAGNAAHHGRAVGERSQRDVASFGARQLRYEVRGRFRTFQVCAPGENLRSMHTWRVRVHSIPTSLFCSAFSINHVALAILDKSDSHSHNIKNNRNNKVTSHCFLLYREKMKMKR